MIMNLSWVQLWNIHTSIWYSIVLTIGYNCVSFFEWKNMNRHLLQYIVFWCCMCIKFMQMQLLNWMFLLCFRKIFALSSVYVPHVHLLYVLRHDGCWSHTFSTPISSRFFCILLFMESPFRFSCPETCK